MATTRKKKQEEAAPVVGADHPLFNITKGLSAPEAAKMFKDAQADSLAVWAGYGGLKVDQEEVSFKNHPHMIPIYASKADWLAIIKGAQTGATVWILLRILHRLLFDRCDLGLYLPTEALLQRTVRTRLDPLIEQVPELAKAILRDSNTMSLKRFHNRWGGVSNLALFHIGGVATKVSSPLGDVTVDEVKECSVRDIEELQYRMAAQLKTREVYASTAGAPGETIDFFFKQGCMNTWLSRCKCSDGGVDLAAHWPNTIAVMRDGSVHYRCHRCGWKIDDPRVGNFVAQSPGVTERESYSVSGLLGPKWSIRPDLVWHKWQTSVNKQEFYNSMLGLPFIDIESQPVDEELLRSCVNAPGYPAYDGTGIAWGAHLPQGHARRRRCAMGIDQHASNCYAVIMRRGKDGKAELVHLEVIDSDNPRYFVNDAPVSPWVRVRELMHEYDVACCIVDAAPNWNESRQLATDFSRRVWCASYVDSQADTVRWLDKRNQSEATIKGGRDLNLQWQVHLHRFRSLEETLSMFAQHKLLMPDPTTLVQTAFSLKNKRFEAEQTCISRFWLHLKSIAREKVNVDDDTGTFKMRWRNVNLDPHYCHALNFARIALERASKQPIFSFMSLGEDPSVEQPAAPSAIPIINMSGEKAAGFIVVRGVERDTLSVKLKGLPSASEVEVFGPCDEMGAMKDSGHCELVRVVGNPGFVYRAILESKMAQVVNAFGEFGAM